MTRRNALRVWSAVPVTGLAAERRPNFMGTLDNHVVALDRETGEEVWRVEVENAKQCGCNITSAPLVVKDLVITGVTRGDSAHRGYINAYDARTGRHRWRFWTIPGPGEPGHETWAGDSWVYGGGSTWVTGTHDPELDLLYWAVGNPAADFYGGDREGDDLYTDSIVALDPDAGQLQWHYQQIPHDVWDYDTAYKMVLLDLEVDGVLRKTMLNPSKSGYVWLLDRQSGEFLAAWPLVESFNWIEGIDEQGRLIGRNEPPVGEASFICPAIGGGAAGIMGPIRRRPAGFIRPDWNGAKPSRYGAKIPRRDFHFLAESLRWRTRRAARHMRTWRPMILSPESASGVIGTSTRG